MSIDINLDLNADSLSDVDTSGKEVGDILVWDGTNWIADGTIEVDTTSGEVNVNGNIVITGNVDILGDATNIQTQTLQAEDNNIVLNFGGNHSSANGGGITVEDGVSDGNDSSLQVNGSGDWYTLQDVGIGTSTPSEKLDVEGTVLANTVRIGGSPASANELFKMSGGGFNVTSVVQNTDTNQPGYVLDNTSGRWRTFLNNNGDFIIEKDTGNRVFYSSSRFNIFNIDSANLDNIFRGQTDASLLYTDASTDRVGIGTNTPSEKLEVNGTIKATDINFTGLATFADDTAAGTGGLSSGDVYKTATGELRIKL